jgi:hypothetical protein
MAAPRLTHEQRERMVLDDLETSFPNFTGKSLSWVKVPEGHDPPDFISAAPHEGIGLEFIEWLDGGQMGPAKTRESQRERLHRVLTNNWERQYQPKNFRGAFPDPRMDVRIAPEDETPLQQEFFACAASVDRSWITNEDIWGNSYYQTDFSGYPLLQKYLAAIRYIGGEPHGLCWIGEQGDGGAFDPNTVVVTLKNALDSKLTYYSTPQKQAHLEAHGLGELNLLVHSGFNAYAYNTPSGHLTLEEIARLGADYYRCHPERHIFSRVWLFYSLDSADDLNKLLGFPSGAGRIRWLARLWPEFMVYPRSLTGE